MDKKRSIFTPLPFEAADAVIRKIYASFFTLHKNLKI